MALMQKKLLLLAFFLALGAMLLSGCAQNTPQGNGQQNASPGTTTPPSPNVSQPQSNDSNSTGSVPQQTAPPKKEFNITARQFAFEPSNIVVNLGDNVTLNIRSIDNVTHGIAIPDLGVSQTLEPGAEISITFIVGKKGTFPFFCSVYCGAGHQGMKGELVVQ